MPQVVRLELGIGEGGNPGSRLIGRSVSADAADGLVPLEAALNLDSPGTKTGGTPYVYPAEAEVPVPALVLISAPIPGQSPPQQANRSRFSSPLILISTDTTGRFPRAPKKQDLDIVVSD